MIRSRLERRAVADVGWINSGWKGPVVKSIGAARWRAELRRCMR